MRTRYHMLPQTLWLLPVTLAALAVTIGAQAPSNDAGRQLHALFDREWEWELAESPLTASALGDRRWNDRWDDLSVAALDRRQKHREAVVAEIEAFPRASLSPDDQINYDIFLYQYRMTVEGFKYRYQLIRTDSYGGVQNSEQVVDMLTFASTKDYDDWLARLAAFPAYIDQNIALMREGIRTNVLLPKVIVSRVRTQLDGQAKGDPAASGFYRPFAHFSARVTETDRARLSASGLERVRTAVIPAFAKLRDFIDREYLPACYDRIGWSQTSSGLEGYAYFARLHTTTDLTPQQIHELGLKEVARIHAEMERVKEQARFTGTLAEFFTFLRSDPRFFYKTAELLDGYRALAKRIDPELRESHRDAAPHALWRAADSRCRRAERDHRVRQSRVGGSGAAVVLHGEPLQTRDAAEVGDARADAARGRARPLPAGRRRAGVGDDAGLPAQCGLHRVCRGLGPLPESLGDRHGSL